MSKVPVVWVLTLLMTGLVWAQAPTKADLLGKTPAEVVKMGRTGWFSFYTGKQGDSTAGSANAESLFARAQQAVNDEKMAKLPASRQSALRSLRRQMRDFASYAVDIGYAISGGGTMWIPVSAGAEADREQAIAYLLSPTGKPPAKRVTSDVTRALDVIQSTLVRKKDDIELMSPSSGMAYTKAKERLAAMRQSFRGISELLKPMPRSASDRVLGFCLNWAKTPVSND